MGEPDAQVAEVLEVAPTRRRRPTGRVVVGALALALVLGTVGPVLDGRLRTSERAALDRCSSGTHAAVDDAWSRVSAMVHYVRPVLDSGGPERLRRSMYRLVSSSATGSRAGLAEAVSVCREARVWPHHAELRRRRAACLHALGATTAFLDRLADDGRVVAERWPTGVTGC